jgi:hypothetical protein
MKDGQLIMLNVRIQDAVSRGGKENIFEPFYTTKGNEGTGLGLSTVYGIVKQHGGSIIFESKENSGTVFKIFLPAFDDIPGEDRISVNNRPGSKGTGKILMVEDDAQVREIACEVLERQGYSIISAKSGEEALEAYRKGYFSFQLC